MREEGSNKKEQSGNYNKLKENINYKEFGHNCFVQNNEDISLKNVTTIHDNLASAHASGIAALTDDLIDFDEDCWDALIELEKQLEIQNSNPVLQKNTELSISDNSTEIVHNSIYNSEHTDMVNSRNSNPNQGYSNSESGVISQLSDIDLSQLEQILEDMETKSLQDKIILEPRGNNPNTEAKVLPEAKILPSVSFFLADSRNPWKTHNIFRLHNISR